jgi:hypothetical protein
MPSNSTVIADNNGEYDDWIELYNKSANTVNIGGWYLTDNIANLDKWEIPAGTMLPGNSYLTFWADEDSSQGTNHCNFKLSASNEFVWLLNANKEIVDSVSWASSVPQDSGYARIPNGTGPFVIKYATYGLNNGTPSGILDINASAEGLKIFPNPATNSITVVPGMIHGAAMLEIRNSLGQLVYKQTPSLVTTIATSGWASGIYFVRYGNTTEKLVIQR